MLNNEIDKMEEFLLENKVSFDIMIRCFNFWSRLEFDDRVKFIEEYQNGKYDNIGWY